MGYKKDVLKILTGENDSRLAQDKLGAHIKNILAPKVDELKKVYTESYNEFVTAEKKFENLAVNLKRLKNYTKNRSKIDYEACVKSLELVNFYLDGYRARIDINFKGNVQSIRAKIGNLRKLYTRSENQYMITEKTKAGILDSKTALATHEKSFIGGLKKYGVIRGAWQGYARPSELSRFIALFEMFKRYNPNSDDWEKYVELIRSVREKIAYCETGMGEWASQVTVFNELYLEQSATTTGIKSELKETLMPLKGKTKITFKSKPEEEFDYDLSKKLPKTDWTIFGELLATALGYFYSKNKKGEQIIEYLTDKNKFDDLYNKAVSLYPQLSALKVETVREYVKDALNSAVEYAEQPVTGINDENYEIIPGTKVKDFFKQAPNFKDDNIPKAFSLILNFFRYAIIAANK